MKTLFIALALTCISAPAFADIPLPNHGNEHMGPIATANIEGEAARALFEALDVPSSTESATFMGSTSVKVSRSREGTAEVVCHMTVGNRLGTQAHATCTTSRSTDGRELPRYTPVLRHG